jgi:succinate dehydrogenase / fumarate reductase, membrane anchor subunit
MEVALSLGRNGLQDWLIQRLTALILSAYIIFWIVFLCINPHPSFAEWRWLFSSQWMRYATLIVLLSLFAHAWVGFWTITTDYIKPISIRLLLQVAFILGLIFCLFWGIDILW